MKLVVLVLLLVVAMEEAAEKVAGGRARVSDGRDTRPPRPMLRAARLGRSTRPLVT